MSHTPGPWRLWLSEVAPGVFSLRGDSPEPNGKNMLIVQRDIGTPNGDEGVANARLIAAAPELLDALKRVLAGFEANAFQRNTDGDGESGWAIKFLPHLMALADATRAVAKAEGQ